jgi:hypothetical protein
MRLPALSRLRLPLLALALLAGVFALPPALGATGPNACTASSSSSSSSGTDPSSVALDRHADGATAWTYRYDLGMRLVARADVLGTAATDAGTTVYVRFAVEAADAPTTLRLDRARLETDAAGVLTATPPVARVTLDAGEAYVCAFHVAHPLDASAGDLVLRLGTPSLADVLRPDDLGALVEVGPFRLHGAPSISEVTPGPQPSAEAAPGADASGAHEG